MAWPGSRDSRRPGHQELLLCSREPRPTGQHTGKGLRRPKHDPEQWTFTTGQEQCPEQGTQLA